MKFLIRTPYRFIGLILIFNITIFILECKKNPQSTISIAGSSTVLPIVSHLAEEFYKKFKIKVLVNGGGSGIGIKNLAEEKIQIGMISREISKEEKEKYRNRKFKKFLIAKDAIAVMVSRPIYDAGIHQLSIKEIQDIYMGKLQNWEQLGGPSKEILVLDKESSRGTRHVFMYAIFGNPHIQTPGADLIVGSNNEDQTSIAESDRAIGYLSILWANDKVKAIGIQMDSNHIVYPTIEYIQKNQYPIIRNLYLITLDTPEDNIKKFIDFAISQEGKKIIKKLGYIVVE